MPFIIKQECKCCQKAGIVVIKILQFGGDLTNLSEEQHKELKMAHFHCESCWNTHHKSGWIGGVSDWEDEKTFMEKETRRIEKW